MTKQEYMLIHPKSWLTASLRLNDWPYDAEINVISGLNTPYDKRSNLYHALVKSEHGKYCTGGHLRRGTEGWWYAIY